MKQKKPGPSCSLCKPEPKIINHCSRPSEYKKKTLKKLKEKRIITIGEYSEETIIRIKGTVKKRRVRFNWTLRKARPRPCTAQTASSLNYTQN